MSVKTDDMERPSSDAGAPSPTSVEGGLTIEQLLAVDHSSSIQREQTRQRMASLALSLQRESASTTSVLTASLHQVSARSDEESSVARSLARLREQVEFIDPSLLDSTQSWFRRLLGWIFRIEVPQKRFLIRYQSVHVSIAETLAALKDGREQLCRDTLTLAADQQDLTQATERLKSSIGFIELLSRQLKLSKENQSSAEKVKFIEEDLLFPLSQRALDLRQQLAINEQGILAFELVMKNFQDLIQGVDRALHATAAGLRIAATVAVTLAEQENIANRIGSTVRTTDGFLAKVTEVLENTGSSVERDTSSQQFAIEELKRTVSGVKRALEEVEMCRRQSLSAARQHG